MPSVVMLRVKTYGVEASRLLAYIESELNVDASPRTAGYVPLAFDEMADAEAIEAVRRVLDSSDEDWRQHLELRT